MSLVKFFRFPFAVSGDTTSVPDASQPTGEVSYEEGYPAFYQADIATDPNALPIERQKFNQLMNDVTGSLRQWQSYAYPYYITSAQNGGTPFSYSKYARVRYDDSGTEKIYESLIDSNTDLPTVTSSWQQIELGSSSSRTWQNVASSRSIGVTYTNSTGADIMVSVALHSTTQTSGLTTTVVAGGVTIARVSVNQEFASIGYRPLYNTVSFIVPDGSTYVVNNVSGLVIDYWAELR